MEKWNYAIDVNFDLKGFEGNIIELSNELQQWECEDICYFDNMQEILESGNMVVATDKCGEEHIQIFFEVIHSNKEDEVVETTEIKITKVEKFLA